MPQDAEHASVAAGELRETDAAERGAKLPEIGEAVRARDRKRLTEDSLHSLQGGKGTMGDFKFGGGGRRLPPPHEFVVLREEIAREARVRQTARRHFAEYRAHRENVALHVAAKRLVREVRGHVVERAAQVLRRDRERAVPLAGDAEVDELDVAVRAEENVARLDVAVHDALARHACQSRKYGVRDLQGLVEVEPVSFLHEPLLEGLPRQELLHDDVDVVEPVRPHVPETAQIAHDMGVGKF